MDAEGGVEPPKLSLWGSIESHSFRMLIVQYWLDIQGSRVEALHIPHVNTTLFDYMPKDLHVLTSGISCVHKFATVFLAKDYGSHKLNSSE